MTGARRGAAGPPLRVAIHVDGPTIRGNERQVIALADELRRRGHRVVVACRPRGPVASELARRGVPTSPARPRGDASLWSAARFARWLRRERPDVLLLTSWKRAPVAALAARAAGVPRVVLRVGGPRSISARPGARWKYERMICHWVDAVFVNSVGLGDSLRSLFPRLGAERLYLVPNAVAAPAADPAGVREELGIPEEARVVMGVGGLEPHKGFDLLVDAVARQGRGDVHLVLVGSGPLRDALAARADAGGIEDRTHLVGQRADAPRLLGAADVFVLSSRVDSMANVMLEAMQAGAAVVAADVPGTWDAIGERTDRPAAGWTVPVDDLDALSSTLREVLSDLDAGAAEAGARAREADHRMRNWFRIERTADAAEAALRGDAPAVHAARAAAGGGEW